MSASVVSDCDLECLVIGAGVIGLAVARALAQGGRQVAIVEQERCYGSGVSSRSSEVVHAGLYYPHGSLKSQFCVRGRQLLYEFCNGRNVSHRRCGKLVVATDNSQVEKIEQIASFAAGNGVEDVRPISAAEAMALEPQLMCTAALLSPSTGIIDSHGYMAQLLAEAEDGGAMLAFGSTVDGGQLIGNGVEIAFGNGDRITARVVINAAGLDSARIDSRITGRENVYELGRFAKGNYFGLAGRAPFSRLIYPVPEPGGLGVHLTIDLAGQARFGPDVEWVDAIEYTVDPARGDKFYSAIRRYWPLLPDGALAPAYAGIRPKIAQAEGPAEDFKIDIVRSSISGGLISLLGFESPGLTGSLAIGEHVQKLVCQIL